jgi:hypothetical protein
MSQGVLQFIPFVIILGIYGLGIAAVVWLFRTIKRMAETQARMANSLDAIARIVTRDDAAR